MDRTGSNDKRDFINGARRSPVGTMHTRLRSPRPPDPLLSEPAREHANCNLIEFEAPHTLSMALEKQAVVTTKSAWLVQGLTSLSLSRSGSCDGLKVVCSSGRSPVPDQTQTGSWERLATAAFLDLRPSVYNYGALWRSGSRPADQYVT